MQWIELEYRADSQTLEKKTRKTHFRQRLRIGPIFDREKNNYMNTT